MRADAPVPASSIGLNTKPKKASALDLAGIGQIVPMPVELGLQTINVTGGNTWASFTLGAWALCPGTGTKLSLVQTSVPSFECVLTFGAQYLVRTFIF